MILQHSNTLVGDLRISSYALCQEAKAASGKPTPFFWMKPIVPSESAFDGNDVYGVRLNKHILVCEQSK